MNLYSKAQTVVDGVAIYVATDRRKDANTLVHSVLEKVQKEAEPRLKELEAEVAKLKKALAYHYESTPDELLNWEEYCDRIWAAGGSPPDEDEHWVQVALKKTP
jgi:hypothetical protein